MFAEMEASQQQQQQEKGGSELGLRLSDTGKYNETRTGGHTKSEGDKEEGDRQTDGRS